jgi:hypothetical protein
MKKQKTECRKTNQSNSAFSSNRKVYLNVLDVAQARHKDRGAGGVWGEALRKKPFW